jgi:hypothetical protein
MTTNTVWAVLDFVRGMIVGSFLCYALYNLATTDTGIVFRYAGY